MGCQIEPSCGRRQVQPRVASSEQPMVEHAQLSQLERDTVRPQGSLATSGPLAGQTLVQV
jgi:hypothetical protein